MLNSLNIEIYPNCTSGQFTRVVIELAKLQIKAKRMKGGGGVIGRWDVIT